MNQRFLSVCGVLCLTLICGWTVRVRAEDAPAAKDAPATPAASPATTATPPATSTTPATPPKYPPFAEVVKDMEKVEGVITTYHKGTRLLAELGGSQMNRDFIVLISIAKGIGKGLLLGGMTWGFGDDWLWQFRKVDERIHIVRRNVRFTAAASDPQQKAINLAFTDSVLFSLPIATMSPNGAYLVDLGPVFMGDLPQISVVLPGFVFSENKSTWASIKGFKDNVELEVAATYASSGLLDIDSVADSRGATINVHYSISLLPQTGYHPRLADDRVGYFLTAVKDWSHKGEDDRFVRYINRWDLQKADSSAELSPPKKQIEFWLEKTIPFVYRKPIREGITEWNKAFEKAGFANAIEVRQQPDNADWDPEDVRYNTFRWITASAGFAMGPSRVNPSTGQILDADIIFDADFLQAWKQEYENFTEEGIAAMTGGPLDLKSYQDHLKKEGPGNGAECELHHGLARELAFGSAVLSTRTTNPADREKLIMQGLKEVTMHEIGHTLGLRHNFKASTFLSIDEMNDLQKTKDTGLAASVMDYTPANLMPKGMNQGEYFSTTIGPYDVWAIEYGYKPLSGGTEGEAAELKKIAARSGEPALAYATDEDTRGIDPDPLSNRFDMSKDPIAYAKLRAQLINEQWPKVIDETAKNGEGYEKVRQAFGILLSKHGQAMYFVSRFVGGLYINRAHKGDSNGQAPFVVVDPAKQREALGLLEEQVFSDKPFQFPPQLYNYLAATRWSHWGMEVPLRTDYPVHDVISMWQSRILMQLLSPLTLDRLHDSELHVAADQDALTTAELLERLTKTIFSEVDKMPQGEFTNRKPAISSLRRNLQRAYLKRLSTVAMGNSGAPQDCQTVAFSELTGLEGRINDVLKGNPKLDTYSRAHLEETASRIHKVLDARLNLVTP
ncbi:MAG: zinc-dependent metalloprotease [Planctomycetia bacterium]|nr:zinc-dependent metalloprotease [Planctomycetia bacterium]